MIGRLDSPNNKYYIQKNTLAALLNTLYSDKSSSLKLHFKMINYSEILKFTISETDNKVNFKVLFGTNLTFSAQERLEFSDDFAELCKKNFKETDKILINTNIIKYESNQPT
jgi:hypothetical protein